MSVDVRAERLNRGLSQRAFAAACGVSLTVVQRLEAGRQATPANAKKVADFLQVKVTDLLDISTEEAA
ncbi:MAG: helix-turn-helix transcriptional regulator [Steroidobacteraceae bacterium]|nr:helix-turn-helix transcriptional regulator [Steroidobacteraceae bacterium]